MNLKDLGKKLSNIIGLVSGYGTIFSSLTPTDKDDKIVAKVNDTGTKIADLILVAEGFGEALKLEGQQKLDGILTSTAQVIQQSELMIGREIIDEALMTEGMKEVTSGYAKILKATKKK